MIFYYNLLFVDPFNGQSKEDAILSITLVVKHTRSRTIPDKLLHALHSFTFTWKSFSTQPLHRVVGVNLMGKLSILLARTVWQCLEKKCNTDLMEINKGRGQCKVSRANDTPEKLPYTGTYHRLVLDMPIPPLSLCPPTHLPPVVNRSVS